MADLATLERALRNADAAGDTQAARTLAGEIIRLRDAGDGANPDGTYGKPPAGMVLDQATGQMVDTKAYNQAKNKALESAPWYARAGQAMDDMGRIIASGVTLGGADKAMGALGPHGEAMERAKTDAARERAGWAGTAGELTGNVMLGAGMANRGLTLAGRGGTAAMQGAKGLAARTGMMAAEGAGYGGAAALANNGDVGSGALVGALGGAGGNLAGEALSAALGKAAGAFNKKPATMTADDLKDAAKRAYEDAEAAGVVYSPQAIDRASRELTTDFTNYGFDPALQPGASVALNRLNAEKGNNVTLKGMDVMRRVANNAFKPGEKSNNALAAKVAEKIDDLVTNPQAGDVIMGDAQKGADAMKAAREMYSRSAKMEKLQSLFDRGELNASGSGSGGNFQNATRQQLKRVLTNKGWDRGFTPDEKAAIESFVRGGTGQNVLRALGQMSPYGNGLGGMLWAGGTGAAAMSNPLALAAALGGAALTSGSKVAAEGLQRKQFGDIQRLIASGGSKAAMQGPKNTVQKLAESKRDALARALMMIGVGSTVAQ